MNVALRRLMSVAEFLEWEERQPNKYEFDGFKPVAMVGVTRAHSAIQANLMSALVTRLRGKPCRPHGSELKINAAGSIRYPDALVTCTAGPPSTTVIVDPVVVFEILSESSEHRDLIVKNQEYRDTPSIQHYVILEQTHAGAIVFSRKGVDWVSEALRGEGAELRLPAIDVLLKLAELYEEVPLASEQDGDTQA